MDRMGMDEMGMREMNMDELLDILVTCGGDADALQGDVSESSFDVLGCDSLALIETAATIQRNFGVVIPDEGVTKAGTPSELLGLINERIAAR